MLVRERLYLVKNFIKKLYLSFVKLAGGRPEVVLPLFWALEKATAGQNEILRQKSNRKMVISAQAMRLIMLVVSALGSVFLALAMVLPSGESHPPLGVIILVAVQYLVVSGMVISEAAPALLTEDDEKTIGWWPITQRELHLARISVLMRPALEVTLALTAIPLLVLMVTGKPPVVTALIFGIGLVVQAVGVTFGVATIVLLVVRLFGRHTAERLGGLLAGGNIMFLLFPLMFSLDKISPWFKSHPGILYFCPPVWFASWGDLTAGKEYTLLAGAGLLSTLFVVWAGARLAVSTNNTTRVTNRKARPGRFHFSGLISAILRPLMRGKEGSALRILLEAHLREDWRFNGSLVSIPVMLLFFGFGLGASSASSVCPEDLQHSAMTSVNMLVMLLFLGPLALQSSHFSSTPEAIWILALADLNTDRLLTAQRGILRGLIFVPALLIYSIRAHSLGASWVIILTDVAVLGLELDLMILIFQPWLARMPFSARFKQENGANRIVLMMAVMGVSSLFMAASYFYAEVGGFVKPLVWFILPLLWVFFRIRLKKVMKDRRLEMEYFSG